MSRRGVALLLLLCLLISPVPTAARTQVKRGLNLFSIQQDVELGRESAVEVEKEIVLLKDRQLNAFVDRIGQAAA